MIFARKPLTPIDRAVADLERQIAELKRRARETEHALAQPRPKQGAWMNRPAPPPRRHPLPDVPVEPLKELEQTELPFARQPELFSRSPEQAARRRLPLRHQQRKNRERFYLWLGLGIVVLGLLWLVVR